MKGGEVSRLSIRQGDTRTGNLCWFFHIITSMVALDMVPSAMEIAMSVSSKGCTPIQKEYLGVYVDPPNNKYHDFLVVYVTGFYIAEREAREVQ